MNARAVRGVDLIQITAGARRPVQDVVAAEEPLDIRLGGSSFVLTMRTPGADRELAAGFLFSEQIVPDADDIHAIHAAPSGDSVDVVLSGEASRRASAALEARRLVAATSACGVCGRRSIDDLTAGLRPVDARWTVTTSVVLSLPTRLREAQRVFEATGGLHAAALFQPDGALVGSAEDVGRHNAVDKVVGAELLGGRIPLSDRILFVSGRTSYEIVQKAVVAGIPIVAAVSAPSSLAIDLARRSNLTLIGFVRGDTFNVYVGAERISA